MAHWDDKRSVIVYWPDRPYAGYPGWVETDCGCCVGIQWGGDSPRECDCNGGVLAKHLASGALALYPGGPFRGHDEPKTP